MTLQAEYESQTFGDMFGLKPAKEHRTIVPLYRFLQQALLRKNVILQIFFAFTPFKYF